MRIMKTALIMTLQLAATVQAQDTRALMPVPRSVHWAAGRLAIDTSFHVAFADHADARLERAARRLIARLRGRTALRLARDPGASGPGTLTIRAHGAGQPVQRVDEDESYTLDVTSQGAVLEAPTSVGVIRGLETVLQLLESNGSGFYLPAVHIEDAPRFPWRGLLVDAGRHFMPVPVIERTLDGMAAVKLNVLHWHLSEDQGFRVESRRYPKLQGMGSDSLFYTQDDIRHVVAYARDRGIRVVPEFDMPGHTQAWLVGYPQFAAGPGPFEIERRFGVFDPVFDPTKESLYRFLDGFIGEMAPLFPDAYWHVGGDEVNGVQWNANPAITAFKQRHNLANNDALQAYFNRRLLAILTKHGKHMEGWDEIFHPDLPNNVMIQSWRGAAALNAAARQGFSGILSSGYYLDHQSSADYHYAQDPVPANTDLTPDQQRLVLGGEACMWAEHVTPETVDSRIWPRLAAIAERLWSPREVTDTADMYRRLRITSKRLEELGLGHESHTGRMLRRIAPSLASDLGPFMELVQPAEFGQRSSLQSLDQLIPLDFVVDAARPDPAQRWESEALSMRAVQGDADSRSRLASAIAGWRAQAAAVQRLLADSTRPDAARIAPQVLPAAVTLDSVAALGAEALTMLANGQRGSAYWALTSQAALARWERPQGLLRVWEVSAVRRLVVAVSPS